LIFNFTYNSKKNIQIEELRAQHQQFLDNSPFVRSLKLTKAERKVQGLPPNKHFERMFELTMNPALWHPEINKVIELQKSLNDPEVNSEYRVPGDAGDNLGKKESHTALFFLLVKENYYISSNLFAFNR